MTNEETKKGKLSKRVCERVDMNTRGLVMAGKRRKKIICHGACPYENVSDGGDDDNDESLHDYYVYILFAYL
jgi:hypothetical protein